MAGLMNVAALASFVFGVFSILVARSDIQLGMAATGIVGGFILLGLGAVLNAVRSIQQPKD